eukprot:g680.t1
MASSKRVVVIIGANRGIGLELAKQMRAKGDRVFATCRKAGEDVKKIGVEVVEGIDVSDDEVGKKILASGISKAGPIDILIHNSGILYVDDIDTLDLDSLRKQYEVNTLGPLKTVLALRSNMKRKKGYVGLMTSMMGSLKDNTSGGYYGYRSSKTALNMIGKNLAIDLQKKAGVSLQLLHPGFVKTDMTKRYGPGPRDVRDSVRGLLDIIESGYARKTPTGTFWHGNYGEGPEEIDW